MPIGAGDGIGACSQTHRCIFWSLVDDHVPALCFPVGSLQGGDKCDETGGARETRTSITCCANKLVGADAVATTPVALLVSIQVYPRHDLFASATPWWTDC